MGEFDFKPARRAGLKARIALIGPGGSGKTYTALLLASGIAPGAPIAFVDTENRRALEYADRFTFSHMDFRPPYSPDRFVAAISAGERYVGDEGVIIVDSLSHGWMGKGGVLDIKAAAGRDFSGWMKATPEQEKLMGAIMGCSAHIISCMRVKVEYEMQEGTNSRGQRTTAPVKIGLAPVQRDGVDYEFSIVGSLDMGHNLTITKASFDIMDQVIPKPTRDLGARIRHWLDSSTEAPPDEPESPASPPASTAATASHSAPSSETSKREVPPSPAAIPPAKLGPSPEEIRARLQEPPPEEPPLEDWNRPPAEPAVASPAPRPALGSDRPPTKAQLSDIAIHAGRAGYTDDVAAHVHVDTICQELFGYGIFDPPAVVGQFEKRPDGQPHYSNIRSARDAAQIDARLKEEAKRAAS